MFHQGSVICRTFRAVILVLAALVIAASCATCILTPRQGWLESHWHGDQPTKTAAAVVMALR
jgi:hypothetical protein